MLLKTEMESHNADQQKTVTRIIKAKKMDLSGCAMKDIKLLDGAVRTFAPIPLENANCWALHIYKHLLGLYFPMPEESLE